MAFTDVAVVVVAADVVVVVVKEFSSTKFRSSLVLIFIPKILVSQLIIMKIATDKNIGRKSFILSSANIYLNYRYRSVLLSVLFSL